MANLLKNGDFSAAPASPVVVVGQGGPPIGPTACPAPGWSVWNNGSPPVTGDSLWTSASVQRLEDINIVLADANVVSRFKNGPGGATEVNVAEIRTNGGFCGLYQDFGDVAGAQASLWAFVIDGGFYAGLCYDGGESKGQSSSTELRWERIEFNVAVGINEFVAYSPENAGAWFFVAQVVVEAVGS